MRILALAFCVIASIGMMANDYIGITNIMGLVLFYVSVRIACKKEKYYGSTNL
jgi:hypothetical protein